MALLSHRRCKKTHKKHVPISAYPSPYERIRTMIIFEKRLHPLQGEDFPTAAK
jgi:hypothetical protein